MMGVVTFREVRQGARRKIGRPAGVLVPRAVWRGTETPRAGNSAEEIVVVAVGVEEA